MSQELQQFTDDVKEMFNVQDQIRVLAKEIKIRRDPLKERVDILQGSIKTYMEKADLNVCNYQDEKLELKTSTRFGSLTKKSLQAALEAHFGNEERANACFEAVMRHIGSNEVTVLRRSKNRKRKSDAAADAPQRKQAKNEPPALADDSDDE